MSEAFNPQLPTVTEKNFKLQEYPIPLTRGWRKGSVSTENIFTTEPNVNGKTTPSPCGFSRAKQGKVLPLLHPGLPHWVMSVFPSRDLSLHLHPVSTRL